MNLTSHSEFLIIMGGLYRSRGLSPELAEGSKPEARSLRQAQGTSTTSYESEKPMKSIFLWLLALAFLVSACQTSSAPTDNTALGRVTFAMNAYQSGNGNRFE